jgi:uncharacterized protein
VRFWDSCAIIPLLTKELFSPSIRRIFDEDAVMVTWWGTVVECSSAIAKMRRTGKVSIEDEMRVREKLDAMAEKWSEIAASSEVRNTARLLLRRHTLFAGDSLQLAAALVCCGYRPEGAIFVCLDQRLRDAADGEGFTVLPSAVEYASITKN